MARRSRNQRGRIIVKKIVSAGLFLLLAVQCGFAEGETQPEAEGMLPVPDYSGSLAERSHLTGSWGGVRQNMAERGVTMQVDWSEFYQDIVDGGIKDSDEFTANLDYRLNLDLMKMGLLPGALITVRAQSRFGNTVNEMLGLLLPANTYSAFPVTSDPDDNVDIALTEFNWTQYLSDHAGFLLGRITTMKTSNEFMGGEGRTQFMNFQFSFPAVTAQIAPYSTLAASVFWVPNENWTVSTLLMNLTDSSTTSGFNDFSDGTTWATTIDYLASLNSLPGGGSLAAYYVFNADLAQVGGINMRPGDGTPTRSSKEEGWAVTWNGWQYFWAESDAKAVDPLNGKQDIQGLGGFLSIGIGDKDTNPVAWFIAGGLSGRGSLPRRDDDTWGVGYFFNDLTDLASNVPLENSTQGVEAYYDIQLIGSASLTLDVQWVKSAFVHVDDAIVLGTRLNMTF